MISRTASPAPSPPAPAARASARARSLLALGYGLAAALVAGVLWFAIARPVQVMPRIRPAPVYTLTDEAGRWFGAPELAGRASLVSFGYTRCGAACAEDRARLAAVRDALAAAGQLGGRVVLVTISVDPEHDTPEALRAYAAAAGAADEWRLLTGAPAEVKQVVGGGFGVYYGPRPAGKAGPPIELDRRVVLVDGAGEIRAEYDAASLDGGRVLRDLGLIEREASSSGWERPVYDAAHLFVCYPQ